MINKMMNALYKTLLAWVISFPLYAFSPAVVATENEGIKTSGFLYGLGLGVSTEIYKGYSTRVMPLPLIGYQGENLSVFGPFVSYKLATLNDVTVSAKLSPRFQGFEASDSRIFAGMAKRNSSLDAGLSIDYQHNDWKLGFSSMFDTLNRSNGVELKSSIGRTFRFGPVFLAPSMSVSLLDKHHVDYYYGVSVDEVNQDRTAYIGDSALNKSLGLSVAMAIFFGGFTRLNIEYTWFDKNITHSPLVADDTSLSLLLLFTKNF